MRRLLLLLLGAFGAVLALWMAALTLLPDAQVRGRAAPLPTDGKSTRAGRPALIIPVAGVQAATLQDNWGDPRDNGKRAHHGIDIVAGAMTPVRAAAPGTIEKLFQSRLGGTTIYERSLGRGWTYYYAHLAGYAPGLHEGQLVTAGQVIGYVGDTGDAAPGNYHLHFGMTRTTTAQRWYQGSDVNPFPYLRSSES
ncbi:M23 family metallopeptidase [Sphingomonas immobilis]|uniref:M23 family metallopeptidase n=1 Tax=Sphingomonas immobilis TaxID=3063997 RepID=A0ABT8ZX03_9SPHN|nr:M23 family metallopeptidase [Sphingomonas sp. CA1-15]MDO7841803.1 M23 family metallopeptidase [Sphingomonas sp. CA1-15]